MQLRFYRTSHRKSWTEVDFNIQFENSSFGPLKLHHQYLQNIVHLMIGSVHQSIYYSNVRNSHSLMQLKSERVTENNFAKSPEIYNILLNYYWIRNILRSLITAFTISLKFIYMKMWLLFFWFVGYVKLTNAPQKLSLCFLSFRTELYYQHFSLLHAFGFEFQDRFPNFQPKISTKW